MQKKYLFTIVLAMFGLLLAACNNDSNVATDDEAGLLRITIKGNTVGSDTRATGPTYENFVNHFKVYVFNANTETLEAVVDGNVGGTTTVSGLSTGFSKKVVVVANTPSNFLNINEGEEYPRFRDSVLDLDYQNPANIQTNGLIMYGEMDGITLSATNITNVDVELRRLVAKVKLGSITVMPAESYDLDQFTITGVSIQRAVSKVDIFGNDKSEGDPSTMYGGYLGSYNSALKPYLADVLDYSFDAPSKVEPGNFFYVFPNTGDHGTLMTVVGDYDGETQYFPVLLNGNIALDKGNTDGTLITSNNEYTLHLTINNLAEGTTDPDVPPTDASLNVTVTIQDWDLDIVQYEVW